MRVNQDVFAKHEIAEYGKQRLTSCNLGFLKYMDQILYLEIILQPAFNILQHLIYDLVSKTPENHHHLQDVLVF